MAQGPAWPAFPRSSAGRRRRHFPAASFLRSAAAFRSVRLARWQTSPPVQARHALRQIIALLLAPLRALPWPIHLHVPVFLVFSVVASRLQASLWVQYNLMNWLTRCLNAASLPAVLSGQCDDFSADGPRSALLRGTASR